MALGYMIQPALIGDLANVVDYLADHLSDNAAGDTPLFHPLPRHAQWPKAERLTEFQAAYVVAVGEPGWRRFWVAIDASGVICGHADLRARPEPSTRHRAILGIGVHRDHRRKGLGTALLRQVLEWSETGTALDWIDLEVLGDNHPARSLYENGGFQVASTLRDAFRIDGASVDCTTMTKQLQRKLP